jgi:Amt family ammonium transporter
MTAIHKKASLFSLIALLALFTGISNAAEIKPLTVEERLAKVEAAQSGINSGDNAWLLVSAALVLMMSAPGLILFYGGLVRKKNVLATMMHTLFLMALMSLVWMVFGYSVAFGQGNAFFGNPMQYFLLKGVGAESNLNYAATVPQQSFMLFQMMFAIITPALITGAFAERMKFRAFVLFSLLWVTFVYLPLAHMVWGAGGLFNWALGGKIPVLDFAGGTVVHISSGVAALVCAAVLGKRQGFPREAIFPHNVVFCLIGTGLLWVGWFGFNAGSAVAAGGLATSAFAATHFSAVGGALSWGVTEWMLRGKPSVLGVASGIVAGLATITPASGFVTVPAAFLIGLAGGLVCFLAVAKLKAKLGYDDSLDVFGVHGVGSTVGMLLCGVFASAAVNPAIATTFQVSGQVVSLVGSAGQFFNQLKGVLFTAAFSAIATYIILKIVKATGDLRVNQEQEDIGLDLSEHDEKAYND